jgi:hypothetical protein
MLLSIGGMRAKVVKVWEQLTLHQFIRPLILLSIGMGAKVGELLGGTDF